VQLRRIVLLFALVLGLVAVVTSVTPPPAERDDDDPAPSIRAPSAGAPSPVAERTIRLRTPRSRSRVPVRRVRTGTRLTVIVRVRKASEVEIEGMGLLQSAEPLSPARFDLLATPAGGHDVVVHPVSGGSRRVARLAFEERARVRLREGERRDGA
jgi:hypothetical protein